MIAAEGDPGISTFVSEELSKSERPELTSAKIIISGGRGMQSGDNFHMLEKIADKITCPFLIVHGENDRQIPLWHAEKTYAHAVNSPDRELKIFHLADGGAEHCGADNGSLVVDYIADWAAEKLGASVQGL